LIIYPAVIGAWIYVATFGFVREATNPSIMWTPIGAFTALLLIGGVVLTVQKKRLEELNPKEPKEKVERKCDTVE
jgi:hypothetical protein